ncbi:MAG: hypothetical protein OQJ98_00820 [Candidatus Pacebacteria bacterium]|nr:hypothetical protein [Candidatus Paceibacterota bacterium]
MIDTVFGTAILLVVFLGLFGAFKLSLELVQSVKLKTGALALAHERVEYIRSLSYDDVGTVGGIPAGILAEEEEEMFNGVTYTRRTFVRYVDAPEDGSGGSDENGITTDYKVVKTVVSWDLRGETREFSLATNIVPSSVESVVGGGTLKITVLDAFGGVVPSALVSVANSSVSPAVALSTYSSTAGVVEFPGAPAGSDYEITVSKSGYSGSQTYSISGSNPNPSPGHLTVTESNTTSQSFSIDVLGQITVETFEVGTTTPLPNIPFSVRGSKTIGTDSESNPIYKYESTINTGASGSVTTTSLEWDEYTIEIDDTATGYDIAESCQPQPADLSPGASETVSIYLAPDVAHSLLVDVKDASDNLLSGASVRLYRSGYDTTQSTGECGQTFFDDSLSSGTIDGGNSYTADVSLSGYTAKTVNNVEIDGASMLHVILSSS